MTIRRPTVFNRCCQVDLIRTVTLPHLQLFGISEGLELRVSIEQL